MLVRGEAVPLQAWTCPEATGLHDSRHMKIVRLSVLSTGRLYSPGNTAGTHFSYSLSAFGNILSMGNSNDTIGNRTRDLPACSAVPHRLRRNVIEGDISRRCQLLRLHSVGVR